MFLLNIRLSSLGHIVIGIEFIQDAVEQFFVDNKLAFTAKKIDDDFILYHVISKY